MNDNTKVQLALFVDVTRNLSYLCIILSIITGILGITGGFSQIKFIFFSGFICGFIFLKIISILIKKKLN